MVPSQFMKPMPYLIVPTREAFRLMLPALYDSDKMWSTLGRSGAISMVDLHYRPILGFVSRYTFYVYDNADLYISSEAILGCGTTRCNSLRHLISYLDTL